MGTHAPHFICMCRFHSIGSVLYICLWHCLLKWENERQRLVWFGGAGVRPLTAASTAGWEEKSLSHSICVGLDLLAGVTTHRHPTQVPRYRLILGDFLNHLTRVVYTDAVWIPGGTTLCQRPHKQVLSDRNHSGISPQYMYVPRVLPPAVTSYRPLTGATDWEDTVGCHRETCWLKIHLKLD